MNLINPGSDGLRLFAGFENIKGCEPTSAFKDKTKCYFNDVELVKFLLESGAKANAQDSNGDTPWHLLDNSQEAVECLKLLLEAGADPMIKNKIGEDQFSFDYKGDMLVLLKEKCNIA